MKSIHKPNILHRSVPVKLKLSKDTSSNNSRNVMQIKMTDDLYKKVFVEKLTSRRPNFYFCNVCLKVFETDRLLNYHLTIMHRPLTVNIKEGAYCDICRNILDEKIFNDHAPCFKSKYIKPNYWKTPLLPKDSCSICYKKCSSENELLSHCKIIHRPLTTNFDYYNINCPYCETCEMFYEEESFTDHFPCNAVDIQCFFCLTIMPLKSHFSSHNLTYHPWRKFQCNLCEIDTKEMTFVDLNEHMKLHNNSVGGVYKCVKCNLFLEKPMLAEHVEQSHRGCRCLNETCYCDRFNEAFYVTKILKAGNTLYLRKTHDVETQTEADREITFLEDDNENWEVYFEDDTALFDGELEMKYMPTLILEVESEQENTFLKVDKPENTLTEDDEENWRVELEDDMSQDELIPTDKNIENAVVPIDTHIGEETNIHIKEECLENDTNMVEDEPENLNDEVMNIDPETLVYIEITDIDDMELLSEEDQQMLSNFNSDVLICDQTSPNQENELSNLEQTTSDIENEFSNPEVTIPDPENKLFNPEQTTSDIEYELSNLEQSTSGPENFISNLEETTPDPEKDISNVDNNFEDLSETEIISFLKQDADYTEAKKKKFVKNIKTKKGKHRECECIVCGLKFDFELEQHFHATICHRPWALKMIKNIFCVSCKSWFDSENEYRSHHPCTKHPVASRCQICNMRLPFKEHYLLHNINFISSVRLICLLCKDNSTQFQLYHLHKHRQTEHNENGVFECLKCKINFERFIDLKCHIIESCTNHDVESIAETYKLKKNDTSIPEHYKCKLCNKILFTKNTFKQHMSKHSYGGIHLCSVCGHTSKNVTNYKAHINQHHLKTTTFSCNQCDKKYFSKRYLTQHQKTHINTKEFPCSLCPKKFAQQTSLIYHMAGHTKENVFVCSVCGKKWDTQRKLTSHMDMHNADGTNPHKCHVCLKYFTHKCNLLVHMRVHRDENKEK